MAQLARLVERMLFRDHGVEVALPLLVNAEVFRMGILEPTDDVVAVLSMAERLAIGLKAKAKPIQQFAALAFARLLLSEPCPIAPHGNASHYKVRLFPIHAFLHRYGCQSWHDLSQLARKIEPASRKTFEKTVHAKDRRTFTELDLPRLSAFDDRYRIESRRIATSDENTSLD